MNRFKVWFCIQTWVFFKKKLLNVLHEEVIRFLLHLDPSPEQCVECFSPTKWSNYYCDGYRYVYKTMVSWVGKKNQFHTTYISWSFVWIVSYFTILVYVFFNSYNFSQSLIFSDPNIKTSCLICNIKWLQESILFSIQAPLVGMTM